MIRIRQNPLFSRPDRSTLIITFLSLGCFSCSLVVGNSNPIPMGHIKAASPDGVIREWVRCNLTDTLTPTNAAARALSNTSYDLGDPATWALSLAADNSTETIADPAPTAPAIDPALERDRQPSIASVEAARVQANDLSSNINSLRVQAMALVKSLDDLLASMRGTGG